MLFSGCKKEEIIPSPVFVANASPNTVPLDGTSIVSVSSQYFLNLTAYFLDKEVSISSTNFSFEIRGIKEDVKILFKGTGENGEPFEKSITITTYEVPKPTVEITVDRSFVLRGQKVKIDFKSTGATVWTIDGKSVNSNSIFLSDSIKQDHQFIAEVTGPGGIDKDTAIVRVDTLSSIFSDATIKYWKIKSFTSLQGGVWKPWVGNNPCDTTDRYVFDIGRYLDDGNIIKPFKETWRYCDGVPRSIGGNYWSVITENGSLYLSLLQGEKYKIISIKKDEVELQLQSGTFRELYKAVFKK